MRALQAFLLGLLMLAFATTMSAANASCEKMRPKACSSPVAAGHCPGAPGKRDCAADCGLMCAAITPFPIAAGTPSQVKETAALVPMQFLLGFDDRPDPPPPRGRPGSTQFLQGAGI